MDCPCGKGLTYDVCCMPLHLGETYATSAEQLMRSRYAAYVKMEIDYILATTHPKTRKYYSPKELKKWAESCNWQKLEIKEHTEKTVSFYAYFISKKGSLEVHKEHSFFEVVEGRWYFVDGSSLD